MTHKNYEITMIDSKTADLIFTAAEFKFTARFEKNTRQNGKSKKTTLKQCAALLTTKCTLFSYLSTRPLQS